MSSTEKSMSDELPLHGRIRKRFDESISIYPSVPEDEVAELRKTLLQI
jgi:hypothetical protein